MGEVPVPVERLPHAVDLPLPTYQSAGASGLDLLAAVRSPLTLAPGARALVPTGIRLALPPGTEGQVRPRSGLALRLGLTLVNSPGTVDADYRGEIRVPVINLGREPVTIRRGMRIAQLVVAPVVRVRWREDLPLPPSGRGEDGFGSTGEGRYRGAEEESETEGPPGRPEGAPA